MSDPQPAESAKAETAATPPSPPPKAEPTKTHLVADFDAGSPLISCRCDPSGRFVFAGGQNSAIVRFSLADGLRTDLLGHQSWVRGLAFDPSGETLYSGDYAGRLLLWPAADESPKPRQTIEAHDGWVRGVAVSPDGTLLATCGNDRLVKLWSTAEMKPVRELSGHESHVYNVAFHPDGKSLVSADLKGVLRHWDVASGNEVRQLDAGKLHKYDGGFRADIGGIRGMNFRADGHRLAASGITNVSNAFAGVGNPAVVLFDWETGKEIRLLLSKAGHRGTAWSVDFHPDGFLVGLSSGGGAFLLFWKEDQPKEFHQFKLPQNARDADLHPDALRIAVAHYDGHLRLYEMREKPPDAKPEAKKETAG